MTLDLPCACACILTVTSILNAGFSLASPRDRITITPDEEVSVSCQIDCAGINWSGCSVQPNAIVIVLSDDYAAHEVCSRSRVNFDRQQYNVTATCDLGGIRSETLCTDMDDMITYNVTLRGFSASSLREFIIVCGVARNYGSPMEPPLRVNGLLERIFVVKVEQQLRGKCKISCIGNVLVTIINTCCFHFVLEQM